MATRPGVYWRSTAAVSCEYNLNVVPKHRSSSRWFRLSRRHVVLPEPKASAPAQSVGHPSPTKRRRTCLGCPRIRLADPTGCRRPYGNRAIHRSPRRVSRERSLSTTALFLVLVNHLRLNGIHRQQFVRRDGFGGLVSDFNIPADFAVFRFARRFLLDR